MILKEIYNLYNNNHKEYFEDENYLTENEFKQKVEEYLDLLLLYEREFKYRKRKYDFIIKDKINDLENKIHKLENQLALTFSNGMLVNFSRDIYIIKLENGDQKEIDRINITKLLGMLK